jgi:sialate O-acetylesterase
MTRTFALPNLCAVTTLLLVHAISAPACPAQAVTDSLLSSLFSDHAVVQHDMPLNVFGQASPGDTIAVEFGGMAARSVADAEGDWSAALPPLKAGGPHTLMVRSSSGAVQQVRDILSGDVFLCSGQSNMAWPVSLTLNAGAEIRGAADDQIRLLSIGQNASTSPLKYFSRPVEWEVASPETVGDWSAVCYYAARELRRHVNVPIGLISSSWGGSAISAWIGEQALRDLGGYEESLSVLKLYTENEASAQQGFGRQWETWWQSAEGNAAGAEPWQPDAGTDWALAPPDLGDWKEWGVSELQNHIGMVWHRGVVTLTPEQAGQSATLELGGIDELDQTWINGRVVGHTFGWGTARSYRISSDLLKVGENVVVVNVLNTWGAGGMTGAPDGRVLRTDGGDTVPLVEWRYLMVDPSFAHPPRAPWESIAGMAGLHNAMIAPLRNYAIRAAVWYQGESDTGGGTEAYLRLLSALKSQWRTQFAEDLPVLVVQLANFGPRSPTPTESGWAEVREAQRLSTAQDPHAALAVTLDIGDEYDIHPRNKQDVGRRVARAALNVVYGEAVTPSGPVPVGAERHAGSIVVTFADVEGALVALGGASPIGFELCAMDSDGCVYTDARLKGTSVILDSPGAANATRVRYCWADNPICTLYDGSGLPAGPFELVISP